MEKSNIPISIYKITNITNNKIYIGLTSTSVKRRWMGHICAATKTNKNSCFCSAIRKYGKNNFIVETIYQTFNVKHAQKMEMYFISTYNSLERSVGYNLSEGGESHAGKKLNKEIVDKMKDACKRKIITPEMRKNWSDLLKERWKNKEYREDIIKKRHSPEARKRIGEKISASKKGQPSKLKGRKLTGKNKERLINMQKNRIGTHHSEETKKKLSRSRFLAWMKKYEEDSLKESN